MGCSSRVSTSSINGDWCVGCVRLFARWNHTAAVADRRLLHLRRCCGRSAHFLVVINSFGPFLSNSILVILV